MYARKLAAIMFTDIQGYTALMQRDEAQGMKVRARHREIFEKYTQQHRGKIIQYFGMAPSVFLTVPLTQ
jgi:adenylate cyclase